MRDGSRIIADESGSGKGNKTYKFPVFQTGLRITSLDGPIEFKYKTYGNKDYSFQFKIFAGECFDEDTDPFRELVIIADNNHRWNFTSFLDLDGADPYLVSTYDEFSN